jgi:hypothetical protein
MEELGTEKPTTYWKSFARDIFWQMLKRVFGFATLSVALSLSVAVIILKYGVTTLTTEPSFGLIAIVTVVAYLLFGVASGIFYGVNSTFLRNLERIEKGLHLTVEPLMAKALARAPINQKSISVEQLQSTLDTQIKTLSDDSRSDLRRFSLTGFVQKVFLLRALHKLRDRFAADFFRAMQEKGAAEITAKQVESYAREKFVRHLADGYHGQFTTSLYAVYVLWALFWLGPLILIIVL